MSSRRGGLEVLDELADEWRELCSDSPDDQPFYRPEYIRVHIRNVIPGATVLLVSARLNGRLQMVLPLVEELSTFGKVPVRRLRAPVDVNSGRFDAVRRSGPDGDEAIRSVWNHLKSMGGWDLLHFRDAPEGSAIRRLVEEARADGFLTFRLPETFNPVVPIPTDPELLRKMPANARLRTKLRQVKRQMTEEGTLNFYRVDTADPAAIDRLFELEASGWKGRGKSAQNYRPAFRRFFDELAEVGARFGYFCLYMLEFNGRLIAAHFSMNYKGRCYSPIVAYDENFKRFAPGHLIVSLILQDCAARGIHSFDITGLDQEWKMKWATRRLSMQNQFVFRGALGRVAFTMGGRVVPALSRWFAHERSKQLPEESSLSEVGPHESAVS